MVNEGLLTDIEVDCFLDLTRQPGVGSLSLPMVTALGTAAGWATEVEIGLLVPITPLRVERLPKFLIRPSSRRTYTRGDKILLKSEHSGRRFSLVGPSLGFFQQLLMPLKGTTGA